MARKKNKQVTGRRISEKSDMWIKIGIVVITVIFIFVIYKIFNRVVTQTERVDLSGNNFYQYLLGIREEYSGKIEVFHADNGTQLILEGGKVINLDSTPIYYKDELGKLLLPTQMGIIFPATGTCYRIEQFTDVFEDSGVMYIQKHKKNNTKSAPSSFLYDGKDMYIFLEETTVTIGKKKYKLSPLSYIYVKYRQNIEMYDYDKNEYTMINEDQMPEDDILATNKSKSYVINLSVDSFNNGSTDQLLIRDISYLNEFNY